MTAITRLVDRPIDIGVLSREVGHHGAGALTVFLGTVRDQNDGRSVTGIDYSAYDAMARAEMQRVADEALVRYPHVRLLVEHRIGYLGLGEVSIGIAAAHPRRALSMDAVRFVIEEVKKRVPIWKREHYADGTREWVDPTRGGATGGGP